VTDRADQPLEGLAKLAADLGPALAPVGHDELLESIISAARGIFQAAACSLALLDEEQEHLIFHVASGAGADQVVGMRVPASQGIAGWVITSGQPIAISDVARDPRFAADAAQSTGYVPRSILAMPLETDRQMLGVISVLDRDEDRDTSADMELLSIFSRQAALAIENSRVFGNLGRTLFRAAAEAAQDDDLQRGLERVAEGAEGPEAALAELAACFNELGQIGASEREAATKLVRDFLAYVRRRDRRW
jgi:GAF domain-containing protein